MGDKFLFDRRFAEAQKSGLEQGIYLKSGIKLKGVVKEFDDECVLLDHILVFKHSMSTHVDVETDWRCGNQSKEVRRGY